MSINGLMNYRMIVYFLLEDVLCFNYYAMKMGLIVVENCLRFNVLLVVIPQQCTLSIF